jgi:GxxExxY protein
MAVDEVRRRALPEGEQHDELTERVIAAAIEVHRVLGPGLSEGLYEEALCHELGLRGIAHARQVPVPVRHKYKVIGEARLDLVVEGRLVVELKAVDALGPVHRAKCITYLRVTGLQTALLINFNVGLLKDGVKRIVLSH